MSDLKNNVPQVTIADIQHLQYRIYVDVATFTILIYDYMITVHEEGRLIWSMPWKSPVKFLFFLTRYMPFFDMSIDIWHYFKPGISVKECTFVTTSVSWSILAGFVVAETILCLRTWAVWGRSKRIAIGLSTSAVASVIASLIIDNMFIHSLSFTPTPSHVSGCFISSGSSIIVIDWFLIMVFEGGVLILMLIKAFQGCAFLSLYSIVYRDGSVFYLYLFVLTVMNVVAIITLPPDLARIFTNLERVIHAILTSRIILNLRCLGMQSWDANSDIASGHTMELGWRRHSTNTSDTLA